ncbi:protein-disulfide reductase DsbD domain-containing protein [Dinghuibacter silviterrae]|uniref:Disulfide bond corrector protein DsbC n=1 Tax=Dinghuibacter silviterrae TaxID=1539049 RepID=A0A4R8DQ64_9BACT|nr:protein-disulfide reductase DsbD domain-containing protein [Dinghuibacter silviterrae]TDX00272.1 disulfide bond corrector protein DsbC [Dinghuibacter silviterrae]
MQKIALLALALCTGVFVQAQNGSATQVQWTYTAKKISEKVYEVHMTAKIGAGWHLYAQKAGDGPVSTSFTFTANPLLTATGQVKELGKKITVFEEAFKSNVSYFQNTVDFVQTVTLKSPVKTSFAGKVEFMVCNDHECLPPTDVPFSVAL